MPVGRVSIASPTTTPAYAKRPRSASTNAARQSKRKSDSEYTAWRKNAVGKSAR